jgi:hypothetical protein
MAKGKRRHFKQNKRHADKGADVQTGPAMRVNKEDILRVHVATPAYDGKVETDFAQQLLMAGQLCSLNFIECSASVMGNGAFIEMARNIFVHQFLEDEELKEFTHFFFIDADVGFEPRGLVGLVRSGLPVSCGVYPRRNPDKDISFPAHFMPIPGTGLGTEKMGRLQVKDGWVKMNRVPTGFLCIQREVLEEMSRRAIAKEFPYDDGHPGAVKLNDIEKPVPWLFYTKFDEEGRFTGEDYCWSDDYTKLWKEGVFEEPIWAWADFDFVHGGVPGNYLHYLKEQTDMIDGMRRKGADRHDRGLVPVKDDNETDAVAGNDPGQEESQAGQVPAES